jgi:hypothetical protein
MIATSGLALLVGAPRAAVEFGGAGLIAYAKLVATPTLGVISLYVYFSPFVLTVDSRGFLRLASCLTSAGDCSSPHAYSLSRRRYLEWAGW